MTRWTFRRILSAATLIVAALCAGPSRAAAEGPVHARSGFWQNVAHPERSRSRALLRQATRLIFLSTPPDLGLGPANPRSRVFLERAIHRLEIAHRLSPDDGEILFTLASAKARWELEDATGVVHRLDDDAIALFERLRGVDPEYEAQQVAFELGILRTRSHQFAQAADEYERAMQLSMDAQETATTCANLAEVTMLAGDLHAAVTYYERAIELARRAGDNGELAMWGLAVALDRLGEHPYALERAREALGMRGGTTDALRDPGVFFEPAYEIHWYEALGHEAAIASQADDVARLAQRRLALLSWRSFLAEGGDSSRWADLARERAASIETSLEPTTRRRRR